MSRSGYVYDMDNWKMIKWRGRVASAIRGKRGQTLLRDLLAALDAMPVKRLVPDELQNAEGEVCALGAAGKLRGIDVSTLNPEDPESVAQAFDIATCLALEIAFLNDERCEFFTPERRWKYMRDWCVEQLRDTEVTA